MLDFSVKRSPAKVCWWVCCNGNLIDTADTRAAAMHLMGKLAKQYA